MKQLEKVHAKKRLSRLDMFEEVPGRCGSSCIRINTLSRFTFWRIPKQPIRHMSNDKPAAPCCCKTLLEIAKRAVSETRLVDAQAKKSRLKIDEVTCLVGCLNGHIQPAMASTREVSGKLKWHAFLDPAQFNLLDVFCCEHSVNISELSDQRAASVLLPIMWRKPMIPAFDTCIPTEKSCPPIVKDD